MFKRFFKHSIGVFGDGTDVTPTLAKKYPAGSIGPPYSISSVFVKISGAQNMSYLRECSITISPRLPVRYLPRPLTSRDWIKPGRISSRVL